eukprot:403363512
MISWVQIANLLTQDQCFPDNQMPLYFQDSTQDFRLYTVELNIAKINILFGGIYGNYPALGNYWNSGDLNRVKWFKYYSIAGIDHTINAYRVSSMALRDQQQRIMIMITNDKASANDNKLVIAIVDESSAEIFLSRKIIGITSPFHSLRRFGVTNQIAFYDGDVNPTHQTTDIRLYDTPNNHQFQIEHLLFFGSSEIYGCLSTFDLTSSNQIHYGFMYRESRTSDMGFYYRTETSTRQFRCLGIYRDISNDFTYAFFRVLDTNGLQTLDLLKVKNLKLTTMTGTLNSQSMGINYAPISEYLFEQIEMGPIYFVGVGVYKKTGQKDVGFLTTSEPTDYYLNVFGTGNNFVLDYLSSYQKSNTSITYITDIAPNLPTGVTDEDGVLQIQGDLRYSQTTDTSKSNVVGGKLTFEYIPVSTPFECILGFPCPIKIAVNFKGCLDSGKTFTFPMSLDQLNNATNAFTTPTISSNFYPQVTQNTGINVLVNENRPAMLWNTYQFRVTLQFKIDNTLYEPDSSFKYNVYFTHICMKYAKEITKYSTFDKMYYVIGQDILTFDFNKFTLYDPTYKCLVQISKVIFDRALPSLMKYDESKKIYSLYSDDPGDQGLYTFQVLVYFQVNTFAEQFQKTFDLTVEVTSNSFNLPKNSAPIFTAELADITIDVQKGKQQIKFPASKDDDGNMYAPEFHFGAATVFVTSSSILGLEVQPLNKNVGVYSIQVTLTDLYIQPKSTKYSFKLTVVDSNPPAQPSQIQVNDDLNEIYKLEISEITNEGVVTLKHDSSYKFVSNAQLIKSQKLLDLLLFPYEAEYLDKKPIIKSWSVIKISDKSMQIQLEFNDPSYVSQSKVMKSISIIFFRSMTIYLQM